MRPPEDSGDWIASVEERVDDHARILREPTREPARSSADLIDWDLSYAGGSRPADGDVATWSDAARSGTGGWAAMPPDTSRLVIVSTPAVVSVVGAETGTDTGTFVGGDEFVCDVSVQVPTGQSQLVVITATCTDVSGGLPGAGPPWGVTVLRTPQSGAGRVGPGSISVPVLVVDETTPGPGVPPISWAGAQVMVGDRSTVGASGTVTVTAESYMQSLYLMPSTT